MSTRPCEGRRPGSIPGEDTLSNWLANLFTILMIDAAISWRKERSTMSQDESRIEPLSALRLSICSETLDVDAIEHEVENGYISLRRHPTAPLNGDGMLKHRSAED